LDFRQFDKKPIQPYLVILNRGEITLPPNLPESLKIAFRPSFEDLFLHLVDESKPAPIILPVPVVTPLITALSVTGGTGTGNGPQDPPREIKVVVDKVVVETKGIPAPPQPPNVWNTLFEQVGKVLVALI